MKSRINESQGKGKTSERLKENMYNYKGKDEGLDSLKMMRTEIQLLQLISPKYLSFGESEEPLKYQARIYAL